MKSRGPGNRWQCRCTCPFVFLCITAAVLSKTSGSSKVYPRYDAGQPSSLVLLQMLFRHGDRSPIKSYPNNTNDALWPQGFGQLTKLGMQQSFEYGQCLRDRYNDFLPEQYQRTQVYIRSTDVDRTLMTAQTLLAGLFASETPQWGPKGVFQPVPIHAQAEDDDHLFAKAPCPRAEGLKRTWTDTSPEAAQNIPKYKNLVKSLSRYTNISTLDELHSLAGTLFCENVHRNVMTRPSWLRDSVFRDLMQFRNDSIQFTFIADNTPRLFGGGQFRGFNSESWSPGDPCEQHGQQGALGLRPLLYELTKNMQERANATSSYKLYLFSAHDTNVIALCRAMGLPINFQPPYLTSIIVELYEQNQHFFVKVLLDTHSSDSPYEQVISGCSVMCPLEQFHALLEHNMLPAADRKAACALPQYTRNDLQTILISLVMVLLVAVAIVFFAYCRAQQRRNKVRANLRYQQILDDTVEYEDDDETMAATET